MTRPRSRRAAEQAVVPDDCPYPKNCGHGEHGCVNLGCRFLTNDALRHHPFFSAGNPFAARRGRK